MPKPRSRMRLSPNRSWILTAFAAATLIYLLFTVLAPIFFDLRKMGFHDWDSAAAYRYITVLSIKKYGELPFWHPYLCGGFAAFGYAEGAPNLVSPFLPVYLTMPMVLALRVEVFGSALISLAGSYLLAGRYTRSVALRVFVAAVYSLNGRWALQVAAGHAWYLVFAYTPLVLYFFERSLERGRGRFVIGGGIALALMVYGGGIYPVPHTALLLIFFALLRAAQMRSTAPIRALAFMGTIGVGLASPKMVAIADVMTRFSRRIESTESINIEQLGAMLTSPEQSFSHAVTTVPAYGWHEWGVYVGWYSVVAMMLVLYFGRGPREWPLNVIGVVFIVLSLGALGPMAPWTLLHDLPVFSSQHVPSRFIAMAILALTLAFVAWVERRFLWRYASLFWVDLVGIAALAILLTDMATVSQHCMTEAFTLNMPQTTWRNEFQQIAVPPYNYDPPGAWAGPSFPAMLSNDGFVGCYSVPDRADPKGAVARGGSNYHGEAYVAGGGAGTARITSWSPNRATIAFEGLEGDATVVYNMNFDPNWTVQGADIVEVAHAVGFKPHRSTGEVTVRYRPRTLVPTLFVALFTIALLVLFRKRLAFLGGKGDSVETKAP